MSAEHMPSRRLPGYPLPMHHSTGATRIIGKAACESSVREVRDSTKVSVPALRLNDEHILSLLCVSLVPLPTKAQRSRHKRDTRDRHPARQTCEPVRELPKPKTTKTRTKDVDRHKSKSTRRPLAESNRVPVAAASPVVTQTPASILSMRPSLHPPRPMNPHPPSSTTSSASGTRPPTSKTTPIPIPLPPPPPSIPSSILSLPFIERTSKTPSRKTSSTLSSLGSTIAKTGTTRYPLPEIPWPPTAAQTPIGASPANDPYFAPLEPLGPPLTPHSPHSFTSSSSRWRTATKSTTESRPPSDLDSTADSQSERRTSRTWSWKRTGLSRPANASQPLEPLPLPPTPAPPSERRSSFTSEGTRSRVVVMAFRSQPSSPRTSSPLSSAESSAQLPSSPSPTKRPKLGWTASSLMAVLPKVPTRPFSQSSREPSPVLVQHPATPTLSPPNSSNPDDLKPRPRRSFLRNPWR
ncbi:hypothetical protein FRC07_002933 [Ceratobasidium sp. 392]|nr:hypothetical protein FRC07_002933 [Ceratobasidium sp. 392]